MKEWTELELFQQVIKFKAEIIQANRSKVKITIFT